MTADSISDSFPPRNAVPHSSQVNQAVLIRGLIRFIYREKLKPITTWIFKEVLYDTLSETFSLGSWKCKQTPANELKWVRGLYPIFNPPSSFKRIWSSEAPSFLLKYLLLDIKHPELYLFSIWMCRNRNLCLSRKKALHNALEWFVWRGRAPFTSRDEQ